MELSYHCLQIIILIVVIVCNLTSCLINRSLAQVMGGVAGAQNEAAKPAAKKPTAKEILEEGKRSE